MNLVFWPLTSRSSSRMRSTTVASDDVAIRVMYGYGFKFVVSMTSVAPSQWATEWPMAEGSTGSGGLWSAM